MVTEQLFNDALSKIFIRFDEMDEKMDRQYDDLHTLIEHVLTRQHAFNLKMREALLVPKA